MTDNIYDYHYVSQGKIEIPGVDDKEEFRLTDVSTEYKEMLRQPVTQDLILNS